MSSDALGADADQDTETLDPSLVEAYLLDHPGFFRNRPDLLANLRLPHGGEGAVSLVERQVALLRERNIEMRKKLSAMSESARQNESLFSATRALVLGLLEVSSPLEIGPIFHKTMRASFHVQMSTLLWLPAAADRMGDVDTVSQSTTELVLSLVKHGKSLCGVLRGEEMKALFGSGAAEGSAAVAPLIEGNTLLGVIAVGDSDVSRYRATDGTLFLDYLTEVIVRLLPPSAPQQP